MKEITRIPLEGLHNTRDLGGFEAADGRHIRPKKLLRSGQLAGMTKKDQRVLLEEYSFARMWISGPARKRWRRRIRCFPA